MGHLFRGGCDLTILAAEFGTPLYVMDEAMIRDRCRRLRAAIEGRAARMCYAGKAFTNLAMVRLIDEENFALDVVSEGELRIARAANFPMDRVTLHGNAKSESFLRAALDWGVGTIVVDSEDELELLISLASEFGRRQKILFRVSPGIDAHTHKKIQTAGLDCKFGVPMAHLERAVKNAAASNQIDLAGLHVHVGSQLRDTDAHFLAVDMMTATLKNLRDATGFVARELDLGGGFGIPNLPGDPSIPADDFVSSILDRVDACCAQAGISRPQIGFEPGRWIVGEAGVTLYKVENVKEIPGVRTYVGVDGGMTDNPRPQLYDAEYAVFLANDTDRPVTSRAAIAGPCCESGDVLTMDTPVPELHRGDLLAVPLTGAYNFSMFNGYNCTPRPAVVFVKDGSSRLVVKRQTFDELMAGQL